MGNLRETLDGTYARPLLKCIAAKKALAIAEKWQYRKQLSDSFIKSGFLSLSAVEDDVGKTLA